jgi:hypothetical protein
LVRGRSAVLVIVTASLFRIEIFIHFIQPERSIPMPFDSPELDSMKFDPTPIYTTRGALDALCGEDVTGALRRHFAGDWGDVCDEDRRSNDLALAFGQRLLSSYRDRNGTHFWIVTEADRSATTVLLPDEY